MNIHKSVGGTSRVFVAHGMASASSSSSIDDPVHELFSTLDDNTFDLSTATRKMSDHIGEHLPHDWRVICVTICPTSEVLVASLEHSGEGGDGGGLIGGVACVSTLDAGAILNELDKLLERSRMQLDGMDPAKAVHFDDDAKRMWWKERKHVDEELKKLVKKSETAMTENNSQVRNFFGAVLEEEKVSVANLSNKFEAAFTIDEDEVEVSKLIGKECICYCMWLNSLT